MDQSQCAFLDDSSTDIAITRELNDEQASFTFKLRELKFFKMNLVLGVVKLDSVLNLTLHPLQLNACVKWSEILLVIGLCVKLIYHHT